MLNSAQVIDLSFQLRDQFRRGMVSQPAIAQPHDGHSGGERNTSSVPTCSIYQCECEDCQGGDDTDCAVNGDDSGLCSGCAAAAGDFDANRWGIG